MLPHSLEMFSSSHQNVVSSANDLLCPNKLRPSLQPNNLDHIHLLSPWSIFLNNWTFSLKLPKWNILNENILHDLFTLYSIFSKITRHNNELGTKLSRYKTRHCRAYTITSRHIVTGRLSINQTSIQDSYLFQHRSIKMKIVLTSIDSPPTAIGLSAKLGLSLISTLA